MSRRSRLLGRLALAVPAVLFLAATIGRSQKPGGDAAADGAPPANSYAPVVMQEDFDKVVARMSAAKPEIMERQMKLLEERYDLADRPAQGVTMTRGKPVQEGVRVKLPAGREVVGRPGRHDARGNPRKGSLAQGLPAAAASRTIPRAAWCFPSSTSTRSRSRRAAT